MNILLSSYWREILSQYEQIHLGFSGGLDSTVLLHILTTESRLYNKLHAIYINHGISCHADIWQQHCKNICQQLDVRYTAIKISFKRTSNIEENARFMRYRTLAKFILTNHCLLTAHHQDDQAETLLLHMARGTSINGLTGINTTMACGLGSLHRPLLTVSRKILHDYAIKHQLIWINDDSNDNQKFSRNFIRHQILPLFNLKWPSINRNLLRSSLLCKQAQTNLNELATIDCPELHLNNNSNSFLSINPLYKLSAHRLNNVLRYWLQKHTGRIPEYSILNRLQNELIDKNKKSNPQISWKNYTIHRYQEKLFLLHSLKIDNQTSNILWDNFPAPLFFRKTILIADVALHGIRILPDQCIEIRFRNGGEHFFWHRQTKTLKKLMQEWRIPPWQRSTIPLLYIDNQLASIVGYAINDNFYTTQGEHIFKFLLKCQEFT